MRLRGMVKVVDGVSSHERDGSWWAWVSWILESGSRHNHELVLVRADSLRPLEPPEAYKLCRGGYLGHDGQVRSMS
jgi:hypothetical protein